ncbi:MAG TPA: flavin reductase family protein [Deltaproteobacteria bacterium]|nr:flavin reductase family protein [Deltaproteobacteria bacterium]
MLSFSCKLLLKDTIRGGKTVNREPIAFDSFIIQAHTLWSKKWLVLTCGDFKEKTFNSMTVGWGSFGVMWNKPFAQVVVRPTRYTYEFMNRFDTFTLCAFPREHRKATQIIGTKSGRDGDKISEAGLTPIASSVVASPGFAEAELIVELKKMYFSDLEPGHFLDETIEKNYPLKDYHRVFFGEILAISGTQPYSSATMHP